MLKMRRSKISWYQNTLTLVHGQLQQKEYLQQGFITMPSTKHAFANCSNRYTRSLRVKCRRRQTICFFHVFKHTHTRNRADAHVALTRNTRNRANTVTLKEHKHKYAALTKSTRSPRTDSANTVAMFTTTAAPDLGGGPKGPGPPPCSRV